MYCDIASRIRSIFCLSVKLARNFYVSTRGSSALAESGVGGGGDRQWRNQEEGRPPSSEEGEKK